MKTFWVNTIVYFVGLVALMLLASGCTAFRESFATKAARQRAELAASRQSEGLQPPIIVSGTSNAVTVSTPPASTWDTLTTSSSDDVDKQSRSVIPAGVKLLLLAVGLAALALALVFVWNTIKAHSLAAQIAVQRADSALAGLIDRHTQFAVGATDPGTIAQHQAIVASLEKERGKLNSV